MKYVVQHIINYQHVSIAFTIIVRAALQASKLHKWNHLTLE